MRFDDLIVYLGEFGTFQKRNYILLCYPCLISAFHKIMWVFVAADMQHMCELSNHDDQGNLTYDRFYSEYFRNNSPPWTHGNLKWDNCMIYEINLNSSDKLVGSKCSKWLYDTSQYESSIISDFNLVCDRKWLSSLIMSLQMGGEFFGAILLGTLSDKYGRKNIVVLSSVMLALSGILTTFSPNITMLIICRVMVGFWTPGMVLTAYVLGMEFVGPSKRVFAGIVTQYFFAVGFAILAIVSYFIRTWKLLTIVLSVPGLLMISFYWLVSESARWLITNNKKDEAIKIIKKIVKINKVEIPPEIDLNEICVESKPQVSLREILNYPKLLIRTLIVVYIWFVNTCVYYGLSLNTSNLAGNNYLNFAISAAVEFPAYTLCLFTLDKIGRRRPLCLTMIIAGIALFIMPFVPSGHPATALAMFGKFAITASYAIIYMFSTEVFPTLVRSACCGLGSTCGRIGAMLAPFMLLLTDYWPPLAPILFSMFSVTAGFLCLLLPETLGRELPDTMEDGENFTKRGWNMNEAKILTGGLQITKDMDNVEMHKMNVATY